MKILSHVLSVSIVIVIYLLLLSDVFPDSLNHVILLDAWGISLSEELWTTVKHVFMSLISCYKDIIVMHVPYQYAWLSQLFFIHYIALIRYHTISLANHYQKSFQIVDWYTYKYNNQYKFLLFFYRKLSVNICSQNFCMLYLLLET